MPYVEILIDKILEVKEERHLSNSVIAKLSDNFTSTVTRILNRETQNPSADTVIKMAIPLGISLDEVFGLKQKEEVTITSPVETALESYSELLKEKDERIAELKSFNKKLLWLLISVLCFALLLLSADLILGGHFGYFRY